MNKRANPGKGGAQNWYFPDGYLPAQSRTGKLEAHEALMLFNPGRADAAVRLDVYFSDRAPIKNIRLTAPAERVVSLRLDRPADIGGVKIPRLTQYALRVRSDKNIVVQFGRMDTTQPNMSYYVGVGFCE